MTYFLCIYLIFILAACCMISKDACVIHESYIYFIYVLLHTYVQILPLLYYIIIKFLIFNSVNFEQILEMSGLMC